MVGRTRRALRAGAPFVLSLLRIVTALVLMEHGTQKLLDFPPMPRFGGPPVAATAGVPGAPTVAQAPRAAATAAAGSGNAGAGGPSAAAAPPTPAAGAPAARAGGAAQPATTGQGPAAAGVGVAARGPGGGGFRGPPEYLFPIAGWIETVGGALLVLGLFTRSAAFVLSGETAVIYFIAHAPNGFFPATNGGEPVVLFCWVFLYVFFAGAGPISVDAVWRRVRRRQHSGAGGVALPLPAR